MVIYARVRGELFVHLLDFAVVTLQVGFRDCHVAFVLDETRVAAQSEVAFKAVFYQYVSVFLVLSEDRVVEVPLAPGLLVLRRHVLLPRLPRLAHAVGREIVVEERFVREVEVQEVQLGHVELVLGVDELERLGQARLRCSLRWLV